MRNNYFRIIFVVIVIGLIIFAAYYLNKNDEKTLSNDTNSISEDTVNEVNNIRLGISNVDNLNPILSKNQNVQDISKLFFEPLLYVTEDFRLNNALAVEFSKAANNSYLIKLRENVMWHNGSEFSAKDVKFTIDKIKELGENSIYYPNVKKIERVEILSNHIVKIHLFEEEELFEYNLTFPIICESFFKDEDITQTEKNNIPMGTGAYKVNSVDLSKQIEIKINQNWWNIQNIKHKMDKITIKVYSTVAEVYNAYKLGSIDMLTTNRAENIEEFIGTIGYNKRESYGREFDYLALNCEKDALSYKEVRQAINYGLNKQDIINTVYGGRKSEADFPLSYGSYLYNKEIKDYEYSPEKAKQILQDNGWTFTNKNWQCKKEKGYVRLKLNIVVNANNGQRVEAANKIKEQLENIGIHVNVISANDRTYDNYLKNKNYDIILTGVTVGLKPNLNHYFGEGNLSNYTNYEAINILNEIKNISDTKVLKEKYNRLQTIYTEDRAYIGICFNKVTTVYSKNISGMVSPTWYNIFYNIDNWYRKN